MRRKDREITDIKEIEAIIRRAGVCRLAMVDDGRPYLVPLCFGYQDRTLYFHSAMKGKKLDLLKKNGQVCFEMEGECELVEGERACDWGMKYESVVGFGRAVFMDDPESKLKALALIMAGYSDRLFEFSDSEIKNTCVFRVDISEMRGKRAP